ncbi:hypothetical protein A3K29_05320 [Candidatus Collierbacteria bacterium RIFOXYB2_FULL_46_14]|uniref:Uncharacterized protein n=1 Tax=Candidatus Collierbacteria bacterium GW2011_GWA2_46_26 TaxID=1618381 RepID=A0A0G1PKZ5_9BACT|nr:MAG: hypothetical protein UX47_C0004G0051 [Candidatus Collierbacteria bacterium GW2011_GWA2_46_26]OGD73513.1 MAG: hypothetical protein A3K29_05320 [Candidatus Collierbacteria bacterium RIFOXYB2_FULL_46_14]OGD76555.1 MAG: hypothetical protein A3K43_05320 [Candidatus Collierbacteria bacterium RIFOXYA2_FULL_46_20]OGD77891.1 MAG: hypothetical protein A3K39_05320 [Candidatus Collierbacteria bacterium RIFOXYC2_FULL_43_15]OGD81181.1 MAG: hypothetical protein A2320_05815 [Pseudomonadales bacterium G
MADNRLPSRIYWNLVYWLARGYNLLAKVSLVAVPILVGVLFFTAHTEWIITVVVAGGLIIVTNLIWKWLVRQS